MNKLKKLDISNQNVNMGISKYSKTQKKKVSKPKENILKTLSPRLKCHSYRILR